MAVSRRLRFEILRRDGYACRYCGAKAPDVTLTVDHVVPVTLGGGDEPNNLVTACTDCNSGKASTGADEHIVEDVDATAMLFAKAMERAAEQRRQHYVDMDGIHVQFYDKWLELNGSYKGDHDYLPRDYRETITRFIESGLTLHDLLHFCWVVYDKKLNWSDRFRYFCGCCWREITSRQELARRMLEDGEV